MFQILHGDCREMMKTLDEKSVHMAVTSPPYYNAREYATWPTYQDYLNFLEEVFAEVYRVLDDGRMFICNSSPVISAPEKPHKEDSTRWPIPFHIFNLCEKVGFKYIDDIQWVKPEGAAPNRNGAFYQGRKPVTYKPNTISEAILVMQKPTCKVSQAIKRYTGEILEKSLVPDGYERSNVWRFNPETASKHTAPYPVALTDRVVQYYSFVGDTVLDPFSGSGTTGVSAVKADRSYVGCELHEEYVTMATERISQYDSSLKALINA